jgi:uracil-DNA glycosylase
VTEPAHPAGGVRDLAELRSRLSVCRLCPQRGIEVHSMPVVSRPRRPEAILVGQAPGIRERESLLPFSGPAGRRLRQWLEPAGLGDEAAFRERLAIASVARCFPGRRPSGGDRPPSPAMLRTCLPWLWRELELTDVPVIVTVGAMALARMAPGARLDDAVGAELVYAVDGRPLIPLPHPSGASTWPNRPGNAERLARAIGLLAARLGRPQPRLAGGATT